MARLQGAENIRRNQLVGLPIDIFGDTTAKITNVPPKLKYFNRKKHLPTIDFSGANRHAYVFLNLGKSLESSLIPLALLS